MPVGLSFTVSGVVEVCYAKSIAVLPLVIGPGPRGAAAGVGAARKLGRSAGG